MKKKLRTAGLIIILMTGSLTAVWLSQYARAATDTCTAFGVPVQTTFTGSAPSSVVAGKTFKVSGITSRPSSSFGVTVNSSTLKMSATNASPTSYSKQNTSTDPSPTTGADTYTATYPDWSLTATGSAGSTITIKLTEAIADVEEVGEPVSCDLSATLVTVKITSATSGGGSSGGSGGGTTTPSGNDTPTSDADDETSDEDSEEDREEDEAPSDEDMLAELPELSGQLSNLTITVKDESGNPVGGAKVTLSGYLIEETATDGTVTFANVRIGEHELKVEHNGVEAVQAVQVTNQPENNNVEVVVPVKSSPIVMLAVFSGLLLALLITVVTVVKRRARRRAAAAYAAQAAAQYPVAANTSPYKYLL